MNKSLTKILLSVISVIIFTACVAEKKGDKPVCGTGEEFNKVSQKCVNVRRAPTSTLDTVEVLEDSAPTIFTLRYTDENNDQAIDCRVDDTENDFEIRSPLFSNIKDDARDVLDQANACATSINPILFPEISLNVIPENSSDPPNETDTL